MGKQDYQQTSRLLAQEADRLWSIVHSLRENGLDVPQTYSVAELSSYDQHPADNGSETFERGKDLGLLRSTCEQLAQVERAKELLHRGGYGTCTECGWPIGEERLQALPWATLCIQCKTEQEKRESSYHRPVEEEVLATPFGSLYYPERVFFDGEDAWQAVASFGTANTPQDIPGSVDYDDDHVDADEPVGLVEGTDAIIDTHYRNVTDADTIYPHPSGDTTPSFAIEPDAPASDQIEKDAPWLPAEACFTSFTGTPDLTEASELDDDLWAYIKTEYPGDPEMEMALELSPQQMELLLREYDAELKKESRSGEEVSR
jgi:YteA family regulatory protein